MKRDNSGIIQGDNELATKARPWPNNAEAARLDCIACARQGGRLLIEALDHTTSPEALRLIAKAMTKLSDIQQKLIEVKGESNE